MFEIQAEFCKAVGNTVRLHLVHVLRDDPMTVSEICKETGLSQGTVSRQLTVLRGAGVVIARRQGSTKVFEITDSKIAEVCDLVRNILINQIHKRSKAIE